MPALRTTSLLSIKPAFVKAGEVVVPLMFHVGDYVQVSATPAMWERVAAEVKAAQKRAADSKSGPRGRRKKVKCPGCDNHGCADCVASDAAARNAGKPDCRTAGKPALHPITKPSGALL